MVRFTKEQLLDELRTIFLFEADHIFLGGGLEMAERFIGFAPGDEGEYCHHAPADVDLGRFCIASSFTAGYDYAFRPSVMNMLDEHEVQDLITFMLGTPKAGGISSGGETHDFMSSNGCCQTVSDTVLARWKLEWSIGDHSLTTRELALLADMTEGAVRNALADKSENGLRPIPGTKNPVEVEHAEALRWLQGRRGFIASPVRASDDRFLTEDIQNLQSTEKLGHLLGFRLSKVFGGSDEVAKALGWDVEEVERWRKGTQAFNENHARQLGKALDLDLPVFLGKVLEVTLRRDLSAANGDRS